MKKLLLLMLSFLFFIGIFAEDYKKSKNFFINQKNLDKSEDIFNFEGTKLVLRTDLYDNIKKNYFVWDSDDTDYDLFLQIKKKLTNNTELILFVDTSMYSYDDSFDLVVKYKVTNQLSAQLGIDLDTSNGINLTENKSKKKTFIKYKVNDKFSYSVHPFDIKLKLGNEFELNGCQVTKIPGVIFYLRQNKDFSMYTGIGGKSVTDSSDNDSDIALYGFIVGGEYKNNRFNTNFNFSMNNEEESYLYKRPVKYAGDITLSYDSSKLFLTTEVFGVQTIDYNGKLFITDTENTVVEEHFDVGVYTKLQYKYGKITKNYNLDPFISHKYIGGDLYFDSDESVDKTNHDGINKFILGVEFINGIYSIVPGLEYKIAGKHNYYGEEEECFYIFTEFKIEI